MERRALPLCGVAEQRVAVEATDVVDIVDLALERRVEIAVAVANGVKRRGAR
jgi:hypothetical protein